MKNNEELMFEFPSVTIMFCQVCEFSTIVKKLSPDKVVRLLNLIFSAFDKIMDANYVYKVETVAEVYMAVAGCPIEVINHSTLVANAALQMISGMKEIRNEIKSQLGDIGVQVAIIVITL
jgi:class 3 adenylate cyclase